MESNQVKVELGCGKTKTTGFIGIDRFELEGVDIVADLEKGIPLEDDSVDLLYACHSLEHFDDLVLIMKEIFRVCKHKAVVCVLAPYYHTSLNIANPYHKQVFNEHTFRFFTNSHFSLADVKDYYFPYSELWGLGSSDNSQLPIDFRCIRQEYFYFPEYEGVEEDQLRSLRQQNRNVCYEIMYHLVVVKETITEDELRALSKNPELFEPSFIKERRIQISSRVEKQREREKALRTMIQIGVSVLNNLKPRTQQRKIFDLLERLKDPHFLLIALSQTSPEVMQSFTLDFADFLTKRRSEEYLIDIKEDSRFLIFYARTFYEESLAVDILQKDNLVLTRVIPVGREGEVRLNIENIQGPCTLKIRAVESETTISILEWRKKGVFSKNMAKELIFFTF